MPNGIFTLTQVNQAVRQGAWTGFIAPTWVEYLVVAGGGGAAGAGGGGGGLLTGVVNILAGTSYTVTVGGGGTGGPNESTSPATGGSNSVFGSIASTGGGKGGTWYSSGTNAVALGGTGGSGGGSAGQLGVSFVAGAQGTSGQGNAGGSVIGSSGTPYYQAGGGGAGTVGLNANPTVNAGNGGAGIASAISGAVTAYAGGGGGGRASGGTDANVGQGGVGGGGSASTTSAGTPASGGGNTGGGGGGANGAANGGSGGSGVVIIRYPGTVQYFTGGTLSYANGYVIHTFNASGTLAPTTPTPYVANDYQISRSLRFNSADNAYLNRTPSTATNRRTWTWSGWVKRGRLGNVSTLLNTRGDVTDAQYFRMGFGIASPDTFYISSFNSTTIGLETTALFRDPSAWYHIVFAFDTTQATASNRMKLYVNGVQQTAFGTANYPSQNFEAGVNTTVEHAIGRILFLSNTDLDGYLTEVNFIDGQALTPSSFGYYDFNTGVWAPTRYVGVYGTNGFYLNFSDNSNTTAATLGRDYSGNSNNWTPNNFSVSAGAGNDSLVDSPTPYGTDTGVGGTVRGNYCTLNPLTFLNATFANGNLDTVVSVPETSNAVATFGVSSGKWYWEVTPTSTNAGMIGVCDITASASSRGWQSANGWSYFSANGNKYNNNSAASYGASYTNNDVIGVALDMDAGTLVFYKNGTSQGTAYSTGLSGKTITAYLGNGNGLGGAAQNYTTNFGQRPFAYTAPSGFRALNTQNLPTPTIGATAATQAGKFFNPVLYTGNGFPTSGTQSVSGVGFQPDWVWIKSRSAAGSNTVTDVVRGINSQLLTNTTGVEQTNTDNITALNSDGFSLGSNTTGSTSVNVNGQTYVAWNWKANGAGVTNTAGSITSTVSANTTSGFSVVTYTGNSTNGATIGHGLGVAPRMVIVKSRNDTFDWIVWSRSFTTNNTTAFLNTTDAAGAYNVWSSTLPSSTVITLPSSGYVNGSTKTYVAYCFAEVPGYSRFGSYVGNGSADGPFVFCGFRPAYVMIKRADATGNWILKDTTRAPYNADGNTLIADLADAEYGPSNTLIDELSNGFKCRDASASINFSGNTYIFMAFASAPQKFALAR